MIDLVTPLREISARVPAEFAPTALGSVPAFDAATPLAAIVGAESGSLTGPAERLRSVGVLIDDHTDHATSLIRELIGDLTRLASDFLTFATVRVPALLNPVTFPAAAREIGLEGVRTLALVDDRLTQLASALDAPSAALEAVAGGAPAPQLHQASLAPAAAPTAAPEVAPAAEPETVAVPPTPEPVPEPSGDNAAGEAAVAAAKSQLGTPYVWGGTAPGGFDCSGLTSWAYRQAGVEIPRLAENQAIGQQVTYDQLQPGDLIVWDGHVAMYAEDGMMIEAGDPVQMNPVRTENIGMPFKGFWRPTA